VGGALGKSGDTPLRLKTWRQQMTRDGRFSSMLCRAGYRDCEASAELHLEQLPPRRSR